MRPDPARSPSTRRTIVLPIAALGLVLPAVPAAARQDGAGPLEHRLEPLSVVTPQVPRLRVTAKPLGPAVDGGGGCVPEVMTHSEANFQGGQFVIQAGFVEDEIAAASYTLPASQFPVTVNAMEMIFAQQNAVVETTTHWSVLVWEGTPATGNLVAEFSSDGAVLPHLVLPPGTRGANIMVTIDPQDPQQVVATNNGSNTFSIGYRVDRHNNPPTVCCNLCLTPAFCCPPPTSSNAFPTTDTAAPSTPTFPTMNWLLCRSECGVGSCPGGWHRFDQLGPFQPGGDWNIRVTYTPADCQPQPGACCFPDESCLVLLPDECANQGGLYQGVGTTCATVTCPEPTGACCVGGDCIDDVPESVCVASGGVWQGFGVPCSAVNCNAEGACCIPATGGCLDLTEADCLVASGVWQGPGTTCAGTVCFPIGACCLIDGTCIDGVSPEECTSQGGVFQGDMTTCATTTCPEPEGACCLTGGCLVLNEADCGVAGGVWAGAGTDCSDPNGNGTADVCECPDINGDRIVDVLDLLEVLTSWGQSGVPADVNNDGIVDVLDLLEVLTNWGPCP
jgi:hypothetical protein